MGRAIAGLRDEVQLATKFANRRDGDKRWVDNSPEWIRMACDASLSRLGIEQIDLHYMHRRDPNEENAAAVEIQLNDEQLRTLDELFPPGAAAGDRYTSAGMQTVER